MATKSKRKPRKAAKKSKAVAPTRAMAPAGGPVTLAEAQAMVQAQRPPQAMRQVSKAAAPPASPASVGAERKKLEKQRKDEIAQRVRDYKATMAIMKKRGARRPSPKGAPKGVEPAAAPSFAPLQVLAEGDSWFDYPVPFFGGGIIPRLERRLGVPILNLAKAGDEVRYMLGVEERELIARHLKDGCPAGGSWDVLLFSGGGNDIVDNPMALWIRDFDPARPPADHINKPRFDAALALVRAGYEDLIEVRDALSPDTHLVFQGYDFAIPDGRGICHMGPWLKPTFDLRRFPSQAAAFEVVKEMLQQFAAMLTALAAAPKVTFINGQGTLPQQKSSWHNELHPSRSGFDRFADLFHATLRALFPNRVV
jgi:GDSL-like Lipase/Acylhydrolase family